MELCAECGSHLQDDEGRMLQGALLCDDCYLKAVTPKVLPQHRNGKDEFMLRLKNAYPAKRQKFD